MEQKVYNVKGEEPVAESVALTAAGNADIHRIGGANVENLRLKPN